MSERQHIRPGNPRTLSSHIRQYRYSGDNYGTFPAPVPRTQRSNSELEHLLEVQEEDEDHADSDGLYPPHCSWVIGQARPAAIDLYGHDQWPIYNNIHRIRDEIVNSIDDPYSIDQLKAPRLNIQLVRPLVQQWYDSQDLSIVYCLLVNRMQFIREQSYVTHHQSVNLTRALLCELIAEKILRRYNEDNPGPKGLLKLANILVAGFDPFQKAPEDVVKNSYHILNYVRDKGGKSERTITALEVAIVSESKSFLASSACQKVVDAIYRGKLVYTPNSFIDLLPDYWKKRPISLYDPRRGPLLNQYRLAVPRTRNITEIFQFLVLLGLYLAVMESRESRATIAYTPLEMVFNLYAWGWVLDQVLSMLEHGWSVYTQNLWSFLDVIFSSIYVFYFATRMYGLSCEETDELETWSALSLDALSCAAPILIPRLAFNLLSENLVFLCLRDMLANFITLVLLASWCFVGFLLTLKWLHNGLHRPVTIGKWLIWIWFGLDGTGIDKAADFHWLLGPAVTIAFAFLGNTLFVTILVSMLSNTFSKISSNAAQEMQYRRAVLTFEGVKADALFAFMPPINVLALFTLLPLKFVLSPRWFHKVNVFSVKMVNAPLLLVLSLYERRTLWISNKYRRAKPSNIDWSDPNGPVATNRHWWSQIFQFWALHRFNAHGDMQAVFENTQSDPTDDAEHREGIGRSLREGILSQFDPRKKSRPSSVNETKKSKPGSVADQTLKKEFATDSDADNEDDAPEGHRKLKRRARKDSMVDFHDNADLAEANVRLQKLEESIEDLHALIRQLAKAKSPSTQSSSDTQDEISTSPKS